MLTPPMNYYGGKTNIAPWIVSHLPIHEHYVEPFAGGLSVLLEKPPSAMETVNDLDGDLVTFWRVLRDRPDELIRACALTPHARAELAASRAPAGDDLERARRTWVLLTQARNAARPTWIRRINGGKQSMPSTLAAFVDRMAAVAGRLAHVSLECRPALQVIADYGGEESTLLYVDPPYLSSSRNSNHYRCDMGSEAEHRQLGEALKGCRAAVVVSGYNHPLYSEIYAGWSRVARSTTTGRATSDASRVEIICSNRPWLSQPLFTISDIGNDRVT